MATVFETGHAKNMANLLKYNQFLATLGTAYNPSISTITSAALTTLQTTAKTNLDAVKLAEDTWKNTTNKREIGFGSLDKFAVQLLGNLKSTNAPQQTVDDFLFLVNKMRGSSTKADAGKIVLQPVIIAEPNPEDVPITKSTSQQSFDQKIEHFTKMILILQNVPTYTPNETQTQVATLQTQLTTLNTLNSNATNATALLKSARINRNTLFYTANTGMLDLIKKSKNYIQGAFGQQSQQYKTAISYKFVRVVAKKKAQ